MYGYVHVATRRRRPTIPSHPRRQRSTLYATERAVLSRVCLLFSKISNLQQLRLLGIILTSGIRYRLCSSMLVPSATRTYKASHAAVWERADRPTSNSNCTDMSTLRRADDVPRSPLTPDANAQRYTRLRELCSLESVYYFPRSRTCLTSGIRYRLCSSMLVPSATRTYKASHAAVWERADRPTSNSNCTDMSTLRRADDVPRSPLTPDANAQRYTRLRELCSLEFCLLFSKISNLQRLRLLGIILTSGIRYRLCSSMLVPSATRTYKARSYLAFD
jgi:L-rhamnose mutarotase